MSIGRLALAVFGFVAYLFLTPALLFIAAGSLSWAPAWVYTALLLGATLGSRLVVLVRSPATLRERARFTGPEDTPAWDRLLVPLVGILLPAVSLVVAGLDHRFRWTGELSLALQAAGAMLILAGYGLGVAAMVVNPFFSAVARIQAERGQYVVQAGPYRLVRHPSYAGALLASIGMPLLLSSSWLVIPLALNVVALIARTRLEDAMLQLELPGYREYAARTRYRLVPGIW